MRKILVTGFEAFGGDKTNPSEILVAKLDDIDIPNSEIFGQVLPVEAEKAIEITKRRMLEIRPDIIILLGVAKGRTAITPERVAINIKDYPISDNGGRRPIDQSISIDGANAYFSTLPIKSITSKLQEASIPAKVSNSAGTYVCNHLFYSLLQHVNSCNVRCGFIHIPFHQACKNETTTAFMPISELVNGMKIIIQACIETPEDEPLALGSIF